MSQPSAPESHDHTTSMLWTACGQLLDKQEQFRMEGLPLEAYKAEKMDSRHGMWTQVEVVQLLDMTSVLVYCTMDMR